MQIQSENRLEQLSKRLSQKELMMAEELIQDIPRTKELLDLLIKNYQGITITDEDEYESWLALFAFAIDPSLIYEQYNHIITHIFTQMLTHSSHKYVMVIVRSLLQRLKDYDFNKYIILTHIYLFAPLLFDPTLKDLIEIYQQFNNSGKECSHFQEDFVKVNSKKLDEITATSKIWLIQSILSHEYKINQKYCQQVIRFINQIIKELNMIQKNTTGFSSNFNVLETERIPLTILSKFNIDLSRYSPTIFFTKSLLSEYSMSQNLFNSSLFHPNKVILLLMLTLNNELNDDTSQLAQFTAEEELFIDKAVKYLSDSFNEMKSKGETSFIITHFSHVETLIEKLNIYLAAVNPSQDLYKVINNNFCYMKFLQPMQKEKVLLKLIRKHSNLSFKGHLVSHFRRMLTNKCSKGTWLRSTNLLFDELRLLEPRTSIDYIGNIISFAFYWRQIYKKLVKSPSNLTLVNFSSQKMLSEYISILSNLQKGLELRIQAEQSSINEVERNEINVCIFRLGELIDA